ncbi:MAG: hypothetical protein LAQ69_38175 [Acidobacteriia bacterium]|nr:hypothetical protein [Terriglobia bacterium]
MRGIILSTAITVMCLPAFAGDINPQEIIQKFAAKEADFRDARNNYTYRQTVKIQIVDSGGNPTREKWEEVADIIFTPEGKRMEKVVYAPVSTLVSLSLTPEDLTDLRNVQPFVLTTAEIPEYDVRYLGPEKLDEIGTYAFAVRPKKVTPGKRYFEGQIWVDDRDLQIVKTYGKGVGELKQGSSKNQAFPKFETYREQIDGKYWFPTYTHADDTLHFKDGQNVHMQMTVKYQDYKHYEGKSTIRYGDVVEDKKDTPPVTKKK